MIEPSPDASIRLATRIRARAETLSPVQKRVGEFFAANPSATAQMTALEIGRAVGTSDASVVRACHALGFNGLSGLKRSIAEALGSKATQAGTLRAALASSNIDAGMSVDMVLAHEARLLANLQRHPSRQSIIDAVARLAAAQRIVVFGTGASSHLAEYMATMLSRYGRQTGLLTASGFSLADQMLSLAAGNAILMLLFGKPYAEAEAEAVVECAHVNRLPMVFITENRHNPLITKNDVVIEVRRVGPPGAPLHGATMICLEAILMGLAAFDDTLAVEMLEKLSMFRERISTPTRTPAGKRL